MEYSTKFRPIKPGSFHLNGKVERSQRTDLDEFYSAIDLKAADLEERLQRWQHFYNWERFHGSLKGLAPIGKYFKVSDKTPLWENVEAQYDPSKERIQEQNYQTELKVRKFFQRENIEKK